MKKILTLALVTVFGFNLNSCSTTSQNGFAYAPFEVNPYDITVLGVSGVLAKDPDTYKDFEKIANVLNNLTMEDKIDVVQLKKYMDAAIISSDNEKKVLVLAAFNIVFNYFTKEYGDSVENNESALNAVHAIAEGVFYALELYDISNGVITNQMN